MCGCGSEGDGGATCEKEQALLPLFAVYVHKCLCHRICVKMLGSDVNVLKLAAEVVDLLLYTH